MKDISGFLETSSLKTGFNRDFFKETNIPTEVSNITVLPFFGDIRSLFILSSLLLHKYKELDKPSKYLILCGWPGFSSLFPYVDEYWSISSDVHIKKMYPDAVGFSNKNELVSQYYRNLNQYFFEDVIDIAKEFLPYYNNGLTAEYFKKYKQVRKFLPSIPSSASINKDFHKEFNSKGGYKVLVYPSAYITHWHNNRERLIKTPKEFWINLVNRLLKENFVPVICKSFCTYDLSVEFNKDCIYFSDTDIAKILVVMRMTGCVLDIFTGISRLSLVARTPFISVEERVKYISLKDYELDDLCGINIPKKYIFSFSTIISEGNVDSWDFDIINSIIIKLNEFLPTIDKDQLPSTGSLFEVVPYDVVRKRKLKRIGTRLLKIKKDE